MKSKLFSLVALLSAIAAPALAQPEVSPVAGPAAAPSTLPASALDALSPAPGGLTASELSRRALVVSPSIKEKRAELAAANERVNQTTVQFFPRVTLLASYTRLSPVTASFGAISFKFPVDNYSTVARVTVPLSDYVLRLADAAAAASASKESARLALLAEKAKMDADARILYFNWLRAQAQATIAGKAVEQTRARLTDAHAAFSAGTISKAELLRIEALVANTELVASRAASFVAFTTGQIGIVLVDVNPQYTVGEGVPLPDAIPKVATPMKDLILEAIRRRYEVRSLDESARSLHRGASAERAGLLPRVDAIGDVTYANPNPRYFPLSQDWNATWSVGLQATWTINEAFASSASARMLDANARALEAKRTAVRAAVAQEVMSAYLDSDRHRAAVDKQRTALAAAEEAYRVTTVLFRAGRATGTDLIEAEMGLLEAKLGDVNARIDLMVATIALRHASGEDVVASSE